MGGVAEASRKVSLTLPEALSDKTNVSAVVAFWTQSLLDPVVDACSDISSLLTTFNGVIESYKALGLIAHNQCTAEQSALLQLLLSLAETAVGCSSGSKTQTNGLLKVISFVGTLIHKKCRQRHPDALATLLGTSSRRREATSDDDELQALLLAVTNKYIGQRLEIVAAGGTLSDEALSAEAAGGVLTSLPALNMTGVQVLQFATALVSTIGSDVNVGDAPFEFGSDDGNVFASVSAIDTTLPESTFTLDVNCSAGHAVCPQVSFSLTALKDVLGDGTFLVSTITFANASVIDSTATTDCTYSEVVELSFLNKNTGSTEASEVTGLTLESPILLVIPFAPGCPVSEDAICQYWDTSSDEWVDDDVAYDAGVGACLTTHTTAFRLVSVPFEVNNSSSSSSSSGMSAGAAAGTGVAAAVVACVLVCLGIYVVHQQRSSSLSAFVASKDTSMRPLRMDESVMTLSHCQSADIERVMEYQGAQMVSSAVDVPEPAEEDADGEEEDSTSVNSRSSLRVKSAPSTAAPIEWSNPMNSNT